MADDKSKGAILSATDGGVAGEHAPLDPFEFLVGPTTTNQFNTAHFPLRAIGCWRTDDHRFGFNSSFPTADLDFIDSPSGGAADSQASSGTPSDIRAELAMIADMVGKGGRFFGCPLSVFGHADPVGNDDYNKALSGRRAISIYALLIARGDPGLAVKLWKQIASHEAWGKDHREMMQGLTGMSSSSSGDSLIRAYMQKLCPRELVLDPKKDFLGRGADSAGKGDYQGCSEFNPLLIFSKEKQDKYDQAQQGGTEEDKNTLEERNDENAPNRRVLVLIFPKGSQVLPSKWPCPSASEGVAGCKKRFWADGETRRSTHLPSQDRKFTDAQDTFACRFHQRISASSVCNQVLPIFCIRLYDPDGQFIQNAPYELTLPGRKPIRGSADNRGMVIFRSIESPGKCLISWGPKPLASQAPELIFYLDMFLTIDELNTSEEAAQKLNNLGYDNDALSDNVKAFQIDFGAQENPPLPADGQLDSRTFTLLRKVHDRCADDLKKTSH